MLEEPDAGLGRGFDSAERLATQVPPQTSAYFFDVDGTLLPIQPLPTDVVADQRLRTTIERLRDRCDHAFALVSGRAIPDLDRIFAPLVLPAAGMHGAELRFPDGAHEVVGPAIMDVARPAVRDFVDRHPGLLLEDKGPTLAVHFRQRPDLETAIVLLLESFGKERDLAVQMGKMVAELKPTRFSKGGAIETLMKTPPFAGRSPVFVGDDLTDESGFRYVNAVGGTSVRIGPLQDVTDATWRLPDVRDVRQAMELIAGS